MNESSARPPRDPSSASMSVKPHMLRGAVAAISPAMPQESSTTRQQSHTNCSHQTGALPSISFVEGLLVNGMSLRIPMATQQPGSSHAIQGIARLACASGGFLAFGAGFLLCARMQFNAIDDVFSARQCVLQLRNQLIGFANSLTTTPTARTESCREIEAHVRISSEGSSLLEIVLLIEAADHSDVPAINAMVTKMAPVIEQLIHGRRYDISISGVGERKLLCAQLTLDADSFSLAPAQANALARRVVDLHNSTSRDAAVVSARNTQILGAVSDVYAAAGTADRRAGHIRPPYTARSDQTASLAIWYRDHQGHLSGRVALPLQTSHFDGRAGSTERSSTSFATEAIRSSHPIEHAVAAIALAQSLAGLHAHASDAILRSNPAQHAHDLALMVGARDNEIEQLVHALLSEQSIRFDHAIAELARLRAL